MIVIMCYDFCVVLTEKEISNIIMMDPAVCTILFHKIRDPSALLFSKAIFYS